MALYAGETTEFTMTAMDFDGVTPITPTVIGAGTVGLQVDDSSIPPNSILASTPMTWDDGRDLWYAQWTTPSDLAAGSYRAKITILSEDGTVSFNYLLFLVQAPLF